MVAEAKVRLRLVLQHSQFWPILSRFMGYYTSIWGSGAIFMVTEPQCALTWRSLALTILADSGPFRELLLTVLGPEAILMVAEPQDALACHSSTLAILPDPGLSHGLLLTVFGFRCGFHGF